MDIGFVANKEYAFDEEDVFALRAGCAAIEGSGFEDKIGLVQTPDGLMVMNLLDKIADSLKG